MSSILLNYILCVILLYQFTMLKNLSCFFYLLVAVPVHLNYFYIY